MIRPWKFLGIGMIVLLVAVGFSHKGWAEERYTVKSGDSLYGISKSLGVSIEALKKTNGLEGDSLKPKQVLTIPSSREKKADENTVGHSVDEIKKMNSLPTSALKIGQVLLLPKAERRLDEEAGDLGHGEEIADLSQPEGEKEEPAAATPLGKWNNSDERSLFVRVVKTFLGVPYQLGGSTLRGMDCSAFVKKIYEIFNIELPRTTREQFLIGKNVEKESLEEGDLVFFKRRGNSSHVGIYIGANQFVHASSYNRQVKIDYLDAPYYSQRFLKGVRVKELEKEI